MTADNAAGFSVLYCIAVLHASHADAAGYNLDLCEHGDFWI